MTAAVLLDQLRRVEGYTTAYMTMAVNAMKQSIERCVSINAGQTTITWNSSDSTFM